MNLSNRFNPHFAKPTLKFERKASICPSCGKKTFKRHFNVATGEVYQEHGRCDRQNNCGHYSRPNGLKKDLVIKEAPKVEYYDFGVWDGTNPRYTARLGYLHFHYVDSGGVWRNTKYLPYKLNEDNEPKRDKNTPLFWRSSKKLFKQEGYENKTCFFVPNPLIKGLPVVIVEGELNAIYGNRHYKDKFQFVATGGAGNLRRCLSESNNLEGFQLFILPDKDTEGSKWLDYGIEAFDLYHHNLYEDDFKAYYFKHIYERRI